MKGEIVKGYQKVIIGMIIATLIAVAAGCTSKATKQAKDIKSAKSFSLTITDDAGRKLTVGKEPSRIVSLAPSNTEILFALGLGEKVVGVTTYCDYPEAAKSKDKVGDFAKPNVEKILSLKPDLILAAGGIQTGLVEELEKLGAVVFIVDSKGLDGILASIKKIGIATGTKKRAEALSQKMAGEIDEVKKRTAKLSSDEKPQVFYELYSDPLISVGPGTFIDSMIKIAGGTNIASDTKEEYPQFSLETLLQQNPEIYIAVKGPMVDPGDISKRSGWQNITAIKLNRIYLVDDNLVSRPGPRIVQGLKAIAKAIHPELFGD